MLESATLPQIQWLGLSLQTQQGSASLQGRAASYSFLAQQISNFDKSDFQAVISGITLSNNGVGFSAALTFIPKKLQQQNK
jgi:hypothetical protein